MLHESVEEQDKPVEDVGQENLNKLPPETTENFANEPAVDICIRDTANIDVPTKKDPEDGRVAANDKFASSEGNTCGKKKVPEEPGGELPKEESKIRRTKNDTEIIAVLFYNCAGLASDFIAIEQASKGINQQQRDMG